MVTTMKPYKAVRDLYVDEEAYINGLLLDFSAEPERLEAFLNPLWTAEYKNVFNHKVKEFNTTFYNEGQKSVRRYLSHEDILGWNKFTLLEEAKKAGMGETYEDYMIYIKANVPHIKIARHILLMAFVLKTREEIISIIYNQVEWPKWLMTVYLWYIKSNIVIVFNGKQKEDFFKKTAKPEVAKYYGLRLVKTSEEHDAEYMIDFVILDEDNHLVLGISVKGYSYYMGFQYNNEYLLSGEARENRGHKKFTKEHGAQVITIISDNFEKGGQIQIIGDLRPVLQDLEKQGRIEKI